jgi:hypothetical protein
MSQVCGFPASRARGRLPGDKVNRGAGGRLVQGIGAAVADSRSGGSAEAQGWRCCALRTPPAANRGNAAGGACGHPFDAEGFCLGKALTCQESTVSLHAHPKPRCVPNPGHSATTLKTHGDARGAPGGIGRRSRAPTVLGASGQHAHRRGPPGHVAAKLGHNLPARPGRSGTGIAPRSDAHTGPQRSSTLRRLANLRGWACVLARQRAAGQP